MSAGQANPKLRVKYGTDTAEMPINLSWQIWFLRELCKARFGLEDAESIKLIVGGRFVADHENIINLDLGVHSMLEMVIVDDTHPLPPGMERCAEAPASPLTQSRFRFYVFCGNCNALRKAKMRVICKECGQQTFLLEQNPQRFDGSPGRGRCFNPTPTVTPPGGCPSEMCTFRLDCVDQRPSDPHQKSELWLLTDNLEKRKCLNCNTQEVTQPMLYFPCSWSSPLPHVLCLPCFERYVREGLQRDDVFFLEPPPTGLTLGCPAGCADSFLPKPQYFKVCGRELYQEFQKKASLMWQKKCCQDADPKYLPQQTAPSTSACSVRDNVRRNFDSLMRNIVDTPQNASFQSCPHCNATTNKLTNSNRIKCSSCHQEWCWFCGVPWTTNCQAYHLSDMC